MNFLSSAAENMYVPVWPIAGPDGTTPDAPKIVQCTLFASEDAHIMKRP
jgi:hypothetical protein